MSNITPINTFVKARLGKYNLGPSIEKIYKETEERKMGTTDLEKQNLEAHVDLCEQRYKNLESRLSNIEEKVESIHTDINAGNKSMVKVIIGATGTIVAGLLSTIVVLLLKFPG